MPFTMPNYQLFNRQQSSPYADLIKNAMENYQQSVEAKYQPITSLANAASKSTYAGLMGPQFMAKLLQNPDAVANMSETQRSGAPSQLFDAAMGQGGGNNPLIAMIQKEMQRLNGGQDTGIFQTQNNQQPPNQLNQNPQNQQSNAKPRTLGEEEMLPGAERAPNKTYAEKGGEHRGILEEGKESGKLRARDIEDLGKTYETALNLGDSYNELVDVVKNPVFKNMRSKIRFFQDKQLGLLKSIGTPEEQELIGRWQGLTNKVLADTINTFKGNPMKGEVSISENMKANDNDTINVVVGKIQSGYLMKEMVKQRTAIARNIMENQHVSKQKALEIADKQVNGDQVREQIKNLMKPKPTQEDIDFMVEKYKGKKTREEIMQQLRAKGLV